MTFENTTFQVKTVVASFWATFYYNIWSHFNPDPSLSRFLSIDDDDSQRSRCHHNEPD